MFLSFQCTQLVKPHTLHTSDIRARITQTHLSGVYKILIILQPTSEEHHPTDTNLERRREVCGIERCGLLLAMYFVYIGNNFSNSSKKERERQQLSILCILTQHLTDKSFQFPVMLVLNIIYCYQLYKYITVISIVLLLLCLIHMTKREKNNGEKQSEIKWGKLQRTSIQLIRSYIYNTKYSSSVCINKSGVTDRIVFLK